MAASKTPSALALVAGVLLAGLSALVWFAAIAALSDLTGSDAAGNAMSQGFATLELIALDILLAVLVLVAIVGGDMPPFGKIGLLAALAAWCVASWVAFDMLSGPETPIGLWPLAIPALGPPLIALYCLWALVEPLRAIVPERAAAIVLGGVALLCLAVFPLSMVRDSALRREAARVADWRAKLDATPSGAPLWRWIPFLNSNVYGVEQDARAAIRNLPTRQSDAEAMLDRDEFPFRELGEFDLDPSPALCDGARGSLNRRAAELTRDFRQNPAPPEIGEAVSSATAGMQWLVGMACACDRESLAFEAVARAVGGSDIDLADLTKLREPVELGRILYNDPPKFSMLTPRATLKAWLNFADDLGGNDAHAAEAIEGARKLDHRTADAVVWLTDASQKETRFQLMRLLPKLDLEATPELCKAGLSWVAEQFDEAYRPTADNPLSYTDLVERLGAGHPLMALQWFAIEGCDAERELSAAEALVRAYGEAPQRAEILDALARLHRKP